MPFYVRAPRQQRWIRQGEESEASKRKRKKIYKSYAMHSDANKAQWLQSPKVNIQTHTHTHTVTYISNDWSWNVLLLLSLTISKCVGYVWCESCVYAPVVFFFTLATFRNKKKKIIKNEPTDWEKYLLENDWATICPKYSQ